MTRLSCAEARRRIQARHNGELTVSEQISLEAHIEWCQVCADELAGLRLIRLALRVVKSPGLPLSRDEHDGFVNVVVSRASAEEQQSLRSRIRVMFDDLHFVYAGAGAAAAAVICSVILLGMMRLANTESPGSLAAMVRILHSPGSNENPVAVGARVSLPRALDHPFATSPIHADDAVFALAGVVTREGRAQNLELLRANVDPALLMNAQEVKLVDDLMFTLSEARFKPASRAGLPVAVNMIWIVAHTTVRGTRSSVDDVRSAPVSAKRTA